MKRTTIGWFLYACGTVAIAAAAIDAGARPFALFVIGLSLMLAVVINT